MKLIKFLVAGIVFGVIMVKTEAISWYRIYEMFHFDAFHMFGIIGSCVIVGAIGVFLMKRYNTKSIDGEVIDIKDKNSGVIRYLVGGTIFGLGWAIIGACPGPIFVLLGIGYLSIFLVLIGALLGTLVYGVIRDRIPH